MSDDLITNYQEPQNELQSKFVHNSHRNGGCRLSGTENSIDFVILIRKASCY